MSYICVFVAVSAGARLEACMWHGGAVTCRCIYVRVAGIKGRLAGSFSRPQLTGWTVLLPVGIVMPSVTLSRRVKFGPNPIVTGTLAGSPAI
jgi:hypothetical protein